MAITTPTTVPQTTNLTTGLLSLSVHDELSSTFNGIQLALHPDIFPEDHRDSGDGTKGERSYVFLVEIRVWDKRMVPIADDDNNGVVGSNDDSSSLSLSRQHDPTSAGSNSVIGVAVNSSVAATAASAISASISSSASLSDTNPTADTSKNNGNKVKLSHRRSSSETPLLDNNLHHSAVSASNSPTAIPKKPLFFHNNNNPVGGSRSRPSSPIKSPTPHGLQRSSSQNRLHRSPSKKSSPPSGGIVMPALHVVSPTLNGNKRTGKLSKRVPLTRSRSNYIGGDQQKQQQRGTSGAFVHHNLNLASLPEPPVVSRRSRADHAINVANADAAVGGWTPEQQDEMLSSKYELRTSFVIHVTKESLSVIKGTSRAQVSLLKNVADLYELSPYDMVTLTKIKKEYEQTAIEYVTAEFVTVAIKDQFLSRGGLYYFHNDLVGKWMYENERLSTNIGVRANVTELRQGTGTIKLGMVTENTKITVRSRSSRIIWLVQISTEMWDYASPYESTRGKNGETCQIYFDKFVTFMYRLFSRWKDMEVTHSLTVVFFSRTYLTAQFQKPDKTSGCDLRMFEEAEIPTAAIYRDVDGRLYEDHYKVVVENETRPDWDALVFQIKKAFMQYPKDVGWNVSIEKGRFPSAAAQGNILEAINVTLNLMQLHYMDRDLNRTGNSIVVISAGSGVFEVNGELSAITKQRMMDNGIGSDMLSLGLPPLHVAPFFLYKEFDGASYANVNSSAADWKTFVECPHWMHLSFVNYDDGTIYEQQSSRAPHSAEGKFSSLKVNNTDGIVVGSNGFILKFPAPKSFSSDSIDTLVTVERERKNPNNKKEQTAKKQQHMIIGREFEDILEACRPRNRGDSIRGMPSALTSLLRRFETNPSTNSGNEKGKVRNNCDRREKAAERNNNQFNNSNGAQPESEPKANKEGIKKSATEIPDLHEWGTVDIDQCKSAAIQSLADSAEERSAIGSESSTSPNSFHSHSFLSRSMELMGGYLDSPRCNASPGLEIQRSLSTENLTIFEMPGDDKQVVVSDGGTKNQAHSNAIKQKNDNLSNSDCLNNLQKLMELHDKNLFQIHDFMPAKNSDAGISSMDSSMRKGRMVRTDTPERTLSGHFGRSSMHATERTSSLEGDETNAVAGGIGAALSHYDGIKRIVSSRRLASPASVGFGLNKFAPAVALGRGHGSSNDVALSPSLAAKTSVLAGTEPPEHLLLPPGVYSNLASSEDVRAPAYSTYGSAGYFVGSLTNSGSPAHAPSPSTQLGGKQHGVNNVSSVLFTQPAIHAPATTTSSSGSKFEKSISFGTQLPRNDSANLSQQKITSDNSGRKKSSSRDRSASHQAAVHVSSSKDSSQSRRKAWVLNPFREQDEEQVLAEYSHSRRRWSHVFPLGEVEFKKKAPPNWKSLSQPAILPMTIDHLPTPQELNDPSKYTFKQYSVNLDAIDDRHYKSHSELLKEMIVQRLIQDFQLVPQDIITEITRKYGEIGWKNKRQMSSSMHGNAITRTASTSSFLQQTNVNNGNQYALSMGHRIHTLSYNESTEDIEVVQYQAIEIKNYSSNMQSYQYMIWAPLSCSFQKNKQRFEKYKYEYRWNKLDNMLCGDPEKSMTEDSRYRRVSFGLIPDSNMSEDKETEYIQNFQRILDYLNKQIGDDAEERIYIKIVRTSDGKDSSEVPPSKSSVHVENRRRNVSQSHRSMNRTKRYTIKLSRGKEKYQWMVVVMGASFYTKRTYHISFHWLVASGSKIDVQVQMLKRRCSQYGLRLITLPQYSKSANLRLHPLISPISVIIEETEIAKKAEGILTSKLNFIDDGSLVVEASDVQLQVFQFHVDRWGRQKLTARQFVHHTGCVFVRVLEDARGVFGFFWIDNRKLTRDSELMTQTAQKMYQAFRAFVDRTRIEVASQQAESLQEKS